MGTQSDTPLDQVLVGDCIAWLRHLPPASVHAIFADPPYNLQLKGTLRRPDDSLVDGVDDAVDRARKYLRDETEGSSFRGGPSSP